MEIDEVLIQKCQMKSTGATVHWLNSRIMAYCWWCRNNKEENAKITKKKLEYFSITGEIPPKNIGD